mgnify:CR=1 FL=1
MLIASADFERCGRSVSVLHTIPNLEACGAEPTHANLMTVHCSDVVETIRADTESFSGVTRRNLHQCLSGESVVSNFIFGA